MDISTKQQKCGRVDEETLAAVVEMSEAFFQCPVRVEEEFDPEEPDHRWQAIIVTADGEPHELVDRQLKWHRQVEVISVHAANSLRLGIVVP